MIEALGGEALLRLERREDRCPRSPPDSVSIEKRPPSMALTSSKILNQPIGALRGAEDALDGPARRGIGDSLEQRVRRQRDDVERVPQVVGDGT